MSTFKTIINTLINANLVLSEQTLPPAGGMDDFLQAIGQIESNNKDDAVGDGGNAIGRYQIWKIYWQDAVEFDPSIGGEYEDVTDPDYAARVVLAYLRRYATKKRLGHEPTFEDMARIHNGGPNGYKKDATIKYWNKVEPVLEIIQVENEVDEVDVDEFDYSSFIPDPNVLYSEPQKIIPGSWR
ncbi:MAG: hypothetical protein H8D80_00190 [Proteobacteria bacterium]|nr:hypothetical protein [Pseudomonadota bacterium]